MRFTTIFCCTNYIPYLCRLKITTMTKLIIFDLDGTLLNTIGDLTNACNYVLQQHGFPLHTHDEYRYFIGSGIRRLIRLALPEEYRADDDFCRQILDEFIVRYNAHLHEETCPYEGIIPLLKQLNAKGINIAVASNKYQEGVDAVVNFYFPDIKFVATIGTGPEVPTKPDPTIVNKIIELCPVEKSEILYLGDSNVDMVTAKNAGLTAIGVLWGFRTKKELIESGADITIEKPEEIWSYI